MKKIFLFFGLIATLCLTTNAMAAVMVRVQPSGATIPSAYTLVGEERTLFGNAEGAVSGTYQYMWDFSDGTSTAWAAVADPRYISTTKTFGSSGLNWARLSVRDAADSTDMDSAVIEMQTLSVDTLNRQKNSAVDRGLRALYLAEEPGANGSVWASSNYPVATTSMALIAFENHKHNLEADDDDIYKKSVQEGLRWLFNDAYEVELSEQSCIGDPEGVPGDPESDDLDTDNDGYGIAFGSSWTEGYEVGLALLAIANSCSEEVARTTTVSSFNAFVNGMNMHDVAIDLKDFLAFAQSDSSSSGYQEYSCSASDLGPTADDFGQFYGWSYDGGSTFLYQDYYVYTYNYNRTVDCSQVMYRINWGDGTEDVFAPDYCDVNYFYAYGYGPEHTYAPGIYDTEVSYSDNGGESWYTICAAQIEIADQGDCNPNGDGWRYSRNYGSSDNSVSQWPVLGLEEAETRWNIHINPKVKARLRDWLAYTQGDTTGGFGYDYPGSWENFGKTGAGLAMLKYTGYTPTDTNVQSALTFLDNNWNVAGDDGNLGAYYHMYAFYKGMKYLNLSDLAGRDWETLYTEYLVGDQNANDRWYDHHTWLPIPDPMSTGAALAMLAPAVGGLPPVAEAGGPYGPVNAGQDVMLDGSGSYHQDPAQNIVTYQWDFNAADGLWWESAGSPGAGEGATGLTANVNYPDTGADETYTVTLRVIDDSDPVQDDTDTATVEVTSGNVPPVAQTDGPWAGLPGDTIVFDGSSSYDPNACTDAGNPSCLGDSIVSFEWDLDGDGNYNEANGDDGTPVTPGDYSVVQKLFPNPVSQSITLRVTDSHGLTDQTSPQVNIVSIALVYAQDYNYCFREAISRTLYRYGIVVDFSNLGTGVAENVVVTLTQAPTNLTILNDTAVLGSMAPGDVVTTACDPGAMSAEIEVQLNRRIAPTGDWRWKAEFDFNGQHYIVDNLPALAP
ncbi:hypothetical protein [Desulfosarcina ovata]|uniref:PKD domain-containing protein n=1 Tax=Desulfosarcina ovata subsp. ovata TaxID=2752305 RepID=A0A5K8A4X3_9BACT|nr:hypothetical protein [Desulfosarcina ovata]BBO87569.1 hypothetical protein DSCOOX_07490 [Desulfosarcina ovata subsp. ovata]